jgi:hypothetical protein
MAASMQLGKRVGAIVLCGAIVALSFKPVAMASPTECQDAISNFKSARSDISTALQLYANCVSSSDGHDDCSSEFETLKSAQDDLDDAVSEYESDCN